MARFFPWCLDDVEGLRTVFTDYTERKRAQHLLDLEDLLLYWRAAVRDPTVGPVLAEQFDQVLVDEYQDTNLVQADILRALGDHGLAVTVVGDDAQAIYSFRSATVRNILDFPIHFPGTTTIALEQNYRSTGPILDLANAVIAEAGEGVAKQLWTDEPGGVRPTLATCPDQQAQASAVSQTVLDHYEAGIPLRDQAVLFRTGHHSDLLEVELRRRRIPFVKYGGLRFLEAAHVRDLLAMLRIVQNPWDELAWMRVLRLARGAGPATVDGVLATLGVREPTRGGPDPLSRVLRGSRPLRWCPGRRRRPDRAGRRSRGVLAAGPCPPGPRWRRSPPRSTRWSGTATTILRPGWPTSTPWPGSPPSRTSAAQFVADLTLDPPSSTGDLAGTPSLDDDWLTLSTVHSAKGGEWGVVHLIHAADGAFPSDMATGDADGVDEERRLFYVALTRAKRHLHLYAPLRYHHGDPAGRTDKHSYALRSRFLPAERRPAARPAGHPGRRRRRPAAGPGPADHRGRHRARLALVAGPAAYRGGRCPPARRYATVSRKVSSSRPVGHAESASVAESSVGTPLVMMRPPPPTAGRRPPSGPALLVEPPTEVDHLLGGDHVAVQVDTGGLPEQRRPLRPADVPPAGQVAPRTPVRLDGPGEQLGGVAHVHDPEAARRHEHHRAQGAEDRAGNCRPDGARRSVHPAEGEAHHGVAGGLVLPDHQFGVPLRGAVGGQRLGQRRRRGHHRVGAREVGGDGGRVDDRVHAGQHVPVQHRPGARPS